MRQLLGPYKGYFILAESIPEGARYAGEAGIYESDPDVHPGTRPLYKVRSVGAYDGEARAMMAAEYQARGLIDDLPPCWEPFTTPGELGSTSTRY